MTDAAPILLITGASRGIGATTARLAAKRGFDVAVNYLKDRASADAVSPAVPGLRRGQFVTTKEMTSAAVRLRRSRVRPSGKTLV